MEEESSFKNLCRTCKNESDNMKYIFEKVEMEGTSFRFADMIMACTTVQISNEDGLPTSICTKCVLKLEEAFIFKKQCELTDSSFRSLLKQHEIKEEPDTISDNLHSVIDFDDFFDNNELEREKCEDVKDFVDDEQQVDTNIEKNKNNFVCTVCFKECAYESHLTRHMRRHFPNKIYRCKICNKTLTRLEHLKRHMVTHLRKKPHVCKICTRGFNKAENLISHEKHCQGQRPHICPICNRGFMREDSLQVHISSHDSTAENTMILDSLDDIDKYIQIEEYNEAEDQEKNAIFLEPQINIDEKPITIKVEPIGMNSNDNYQDNNDFSTAEDQKDVLENINLDSTELSCEECDKKFSMKIDLEIHKQKHSSDKVFRCNSCEKTFIRADHLKRHMISRHEDSKPFICSICFKTFNRRDHMLRHVKIHSTEKPFSCDQCDDKFAREDGLIKHKATKHGIGEKFPPEKKYNCTKCTKSFTTEKYRDVHMKAHSFKSQSVQCKTCEQTFDNKDELSRHLKLANNCSRRFLCSECGQRFTKKDYLQVHIRRHRGEKPFKCRFCGKGFPRTTDLKAHEKCHTGEKNHLCIVCGKGFGRAYKLTLHMRTHTGEKPYVCTYCDAAFAQSNDLKAHTRRHTGERYYCDLCNDAFLMGYMLTQHKKNVHGVDLPESQKHLARLNQSAPQPIKPEIRRPIIDPNPSQLLSFAVSQTLNLMHNANNKF